MPAAALSARGHTAIASNRLTDGPEDTDVIVGQRIGDFRTGEGWARLAAMGRYKMVYEIDDDIWTVDPSNKAAYVGYSKPELREAMQASIEVSDLVVVTNDTLAEVIRPMNPNIAVVPNFIPAWLLDLPMPNTGGKSVTVGWSGGSSHAMDWREAMPAIAPTLFREVNTTMHFIGWHPPDAGDYLPRYRRRGTGWIASVPDFYRSIDFDIGLAPLTHHVFNRSKSHIKALEYAALGIPVIASDVGPYSDFVRHGETGFLVRQPHEWRRYLRQLLDPVVRQEMGAKARALAAQHTIEGNVELWEKALCTG
jgi:glycosyltransferase involved in cell wall biosynthesis